MHWAKLYIGRRYSEFASGPDILDGCWQLVRRVWRDIFGLSIPDVGVDMQSDRAIAAAFAAAGAAYGIRARRIGAPVDGCAVYLTAARWPHHVGIFADCDGGGIVHALQDAGVVFTRRHALRFLGLRELAFYRPDGLVRNMT